VTAGAVIGRGELVRRIKLRLDHLGGSLDAHACYLLYRGMRTLALRVRYQNESAGKIARFLESRDEIDHVNYPGLESHPQHEMARELFTGFGGMLSFVPKGGEAATERILHALRLPIRAPSLGGPETLVAVPAHVSHASMSDEELARVGISKALVRMSVGLENTEDLIEDLTQALEGSAA
jgi:cystathionine beta-lyase/cystathionine gamma-synthase